jgi:hypothetical protein
LNGTTDLLYYQNLSNGGALQVLDVTSATSSQTRNITTDSTAALIIGALRVNSLHDNLPFDGLIDEVRISNTALSRKRSPTMNKANENKKPEIPFMKGMNFGFAADRGWYGSEAALAAIGKMKALNIDWVAAHVTFVMETYASNRVFFDPVFTPADHEVLAWVAAARKAGLKVMLKPIIEPLDGVWRGVVDPRWTASPPSPS